jgi:hypothetical protein
MSSFAKGTGPSTSAGVEEHAENVAVAIKKAISFVDFKKGICSSLAYASVSIWYTLMKIQKKFLLNFTEVILI